MIKKCIELCGMSNIVAFEKMHGLGNDFVITPQNSKFFAQDSTFESRVKMIADRRLGIGCDQLIGYAEVDGSVVMNIYNSDGKVAKACGNGARCIAKLYFDKYPDRSHLKIIAYDRVLECVKISDHLIAVNMGLPSFNVPWIPNMYELNEHIAPYQNNDFNGEFMCVDVGNPHLVLFTRHNSTQEVATIAAHLEKSSLFPDGVNVNFAQIVDHYVDMVGNHLPLRSIKLLVWERGVGFTLACGSGACASFVAAHKLGFVDNSTVVQFEYGQLFISYDAVGNIIMQGPATKVASGYYMS